MSTTQLILMQDEKRGDSPRKQIRLPVIAPKDDQLATSSNRNSRVAGPAVAPRARLPPRSRTGCWTCRLRKVKCDEGRPICVQCGRLGHTCDYSPRLSFRDDTTRVVERMEGVTVAGSTVWDRQFYTFSRRRRSTDAAIAAASPAASSAGSVIADDLPPCATLMTDEERERKAEASSPGTYNVVVNPGSFQHLPEYSDDIEIKRERLSPLRRTSIATSLASSLGRESALEGIPVPGDPNTIVLPRFEDLSRKPAREIKSPVSPVIQHTFIKLEDQETKPLRTEEELRSLEHFRTVVWRQLVPTESEGATSVVLLDKIAAEFPPLLHAMLAIASQSLAQRDGRDPYAALQYYTKAIGYLKREEDSASDGVFLTHFLMLIYEIATADTEHSLIRTHHLSMLLKIALLRRNTPTSETFPYIIWRICNIDLDALFSGTGTGEFVTHMLEHESIPPPSYHLFPLGADGSSMVFNEEKETLPTILTIDYEVTVMAVRLAMLAQEFRQDDGFRHMDLRQRDTVVRLRQGRIFEIQEALRQLWTAPRVFTISQNPLPPRSQRVWEHAFSLYRACLIFSHTSMWPAQRVDTLPDYDEEITYAATEIIQLAQGMLYSGHMECRFLVFPVFMAGYASSNGSHKMMALDVIGRMERESIGRNTSATRTVLERVYEKQNSHFMTTGHSLDVDWMETMIENGLTVINFGT